jgi:hypothetical protein
MPRPELAFSLAQAFTPVGGKAVVTTLFLHAPFTGQWRVLAKISANPETPPPEGGH